MVTQGWRSTSDLVDPVAAAGGSFTVSLAGWLGGCALEGWVNDHLDRFEISPELGGPDPICGPDSPPDDPAPFAPTGSPTPDRTRARQRFGISEAGGGAIADFVHGASAATTAAGV
jgi:hypothetical protein